ncbi:alkaline phosphatase [Ruminococcaceae bacterium OttesenSCG-928-D13]|nr:alkaline phosphatase [Ruminococcaceae bacterium OttesenSCG-928-D13]
MKKIGSLFLSLLMVISLLAGCANGQTASPSSVAASSSMMQPDAQDETAQTQAPKHIFYFIGDGMGLSHRQLAEVFARYKTGDENHVLTMNAMPVTTNITTHNSNTLVTDSAAAGTAMATGQKTQTGVIGMNEDGTETYKSISEALREKGMGIGLITTVSITHATPAAFGAHTANRNDEAAIAEQYLANEWDFLAGGGFNYFADTTEGGKREEGDSLLDDFENAGYTIDLDLESFTQTDFSAVEKYLGLYEPKYLTEVITQRNGTKVSPELSEIVQAGIDVLGQNEEGFFMMVEGGYIDGASHNNDTAATLHEVLAFEEAVQVAVDFYNQYPEDTLILVTADHETGGLSLGYNAYTLDLERLDTIKVAYEREIDVFLQAGDVDGYRAAMQQHYGIEVSDEDMEKILTGIENFDITGLLADAGFTDPAIVAEYEGMRHMLGISGHISSYLLAEETRIGWGSQTHTSEPVPLTVLGVEGERFATCRDNTDIPKTLAEIMGVAIG